MNVAQSISRVKQLEIIQVFLGSVVIALCAQIKIPLYFSPVPFTGQVFAVLFVAAMLGKRRGTMAAALYLFEGAVGLPVFAGGSTGLATLIGPHAGYLLSFPLEAYLFGLVLEKYHSRPIIKTGLAALVPLVNLGMGSLGLILYVGTKQALVMGFYPFVAIDIAKALVVVACAKVRVKCK